MQWLFDIILGIVDKAGYALKSWVLEQNYTTLAEVLATIQGTRFYARRNASTQSIPSGQWTKVQLNNRMLDTKDEWDGANFRLVPKESGYYQIGWGIGFRPNVGVIGKIVGAVRVTGGTVCTIATHIPIVDYGGTATAFLWNLSVGSYVELWVWQGSGTSQPLDYTNFMNYLSLERIP